MTMIADRRLCLTADKSQVVEEVDTRSAWLFVPIGREISDADAEKYGLSVVDGRIVVGAKSTAKPEDKMVSAPENKAADPEGHKAAPESDPEPEPEAKEAQKPGRRPTRKRGG